MTKTMKDASFCAEGTISFAMLIIIIQNDVTLETETKKQWCCSLRVLARGAGLNPEEVVAHPQFLRRILRNTNHVRLGVSKGRFATIASHCRSALRFIRVGNEYTYLHPMTPDWQTLYDQVKTSYEKAAMARGLRFFSAKGVTRDSVDQETALRFRNALFDETTVKKPSTHYQSFCRVWNRQQGRIAEWPDVVFAVPRTQDQLVLPWETFPKSFLTDVDRFFEQQVCDDETDDSSPPRPLRATTVRCQKHWIRFAASALVASGVDPAEITSLAVLTKKPAAKRLLRAIRDRKEHKPRSLAGNIARMLAKIAVHWTDEPKKTVKSLRKMSNKFFGRVRAERGQTTRQRLIPLRQEANLAKLFLLPRVLADELKRRGVSSRQDALLLQQAVALAVETYSPIRIGTLVQLRADKHLAWTGKPGRLKLVFDIGPDIVKTDVPLSFPVPSEVAELIRWYIDAGIPRLGFPPSPFLFPTRDEHVGKDANNFAKQLKKLIWSSTGLEVNVHLYRHVVHLIILRKFPGAYAMVSRILGHKRLDTALQNYAHEDQTIAMETWQDIVQTGVENQSLLSKASPRDIAYGLNGGMM